MVSFSTSTMSGQIVPPPGGKDSNISMMPCVTNVSGSQNHMVGMNQPSYDAFLNPAGPFGLSNVQYQYPYVAHVPFQSPYGPYGS